MLSEFHIDMCSLLKSSILMYFKFNNYNLYYENHVGIFGCNHFMTQ